jgi:hypothetical protein
VAWRASADTQASFADAADELFSAIVFRIAIRHAIPTRNIKDRELAALIVRRGCRRRIQCRRRPMLRFPFSDFFAVRFGTHVPNFF